MQPAVAKAAFVSIDNPAEAMAVYGEIAFGNLFATDIGESAAAVFALEFSNSRATNDVATGISVSGASSSSDRPGKENFAARAATGVLGVSSDGAGVFDGFSGAAFLDTLTVEGEGATALHLEMRIDGTIGATGGGVGGMFRTAPGLVITLAELEVLDRTPGVRAGGNLGSSATATVIDLAPESTLCCAGVDLGPGFIDSFAVGLSAPGFGGSVDAVIRIDISSPDNRFPIAMFLEADGAADFFSTAAITSVTASRGGVLLENASIVGGGGTLDIVALAAANVAGGGSTVVPLPAGGVLLVTALGLLFRKARRSAQD